MSISAEELASIYSRLAVLESQQVTGTDALEEVFRKYSVTAESSSDAFSGLDERFKHAASLPNAIEAIKDIFTEELDMKSAVNVSLDSKSTMYRTRNHKLLQMNSDSLRLQDSISKLSPQLREVTELCRNLQALEKEKNEHNAKLLSVELEKSMAIQRECGASLTSVTTKIDAEEADLEAKAKENDDLCVKLEQFRAHLELRREKQRNEARTRELQGQLEAAQKAQLAFVSQQEQLKRESCHSKVIHAQETVLQLEAQLSMYDKKFAEFQDTLRRTAEVMVQLEERETALQSAAQRLQAENAEWKDRSALADVALVEALDRKETVHKEAVALKTAAAKAEKRCRELQALRQRQHQSQQTAPVVL